MSLSENIAKNTIYITSSRIASTILGVFAVALILRYFSAEDFGRYTTVFAFIILFGTLVDFGLNLTTTQDISVPGANIPRTISSVATLRIIANIALIIFIPILLLAFPYDQIIKKSILVASIMFFSTSLFQVFASYFQKTLSIVKVSISEVGGKIFLLLGVIAIVYFKISFVWAILIISASSIAQLGAIFYFIKKEIPLFLCFDSEIYKRIVKKTWPVALSVVFTTFYFKGDTIILSLVRPLEDVGIYGAAYKILEVLITIPILIMGIILPHITESFINSDMIKFERLIQKTWDGLCFITIPIVFGIFILSGDIIALVAGDGYERSALVLKILILAVGVIFLGSLFTHAIVAIEKQKSMVAYYGAVAAISIFLYIAFIPVYSYYAAAIITVLSEIAIASLAAFKVWKQTRFKLSLSIFFRSALASIFMCAALFLLSKLNIIILIFLGSALYFLFSFFFKAIPQDLILIAKSKFSKDV